MVMIGFEYKTGILATTGNKYAVKRDEDGYLVQLDESLKGTFEVAAILRKAADEIKEGKHGN